MFFQSPEERFKKIYEEYSPMVRAVLYNMTGEIFLDDLMQETFIKVWRGLPRFDFRSSVKTWIYRVSVNTAIDHLRKSKVSLGQVQHWTDKEVLEGPSLEAKEDSALLQQSLLEIEEHLRSVVTLYYFENLKVEEIAKILEIPAGTVKSRLSTARALLKDVLQKKGIHL